MEKHSNLSSIISWIDEQQPRMEKLVENWANINSGSDNLAGLSAMKKALFNAFAPLKGERSVLALQPSEHWDNEGNVHHCQHGEAILIRKRPKAAWRFLLGGHMDTVFDSKSPFQKCVRKDNELLVGPGVADMKGGLVVLLVTLEALENSIFAEKIGWDIFITPDEEIGSTGSYALWRQLAWQNHFGILFEPSLPDGAIVSERKGSSNYIIIAHGASAHAGRDFTKGANAVAAISQVIFEIDALNKQMSHVHINVGVVHGGTVSNIVPDKAFALVNIRCNSEEDLQKAEKALHAAAALAGNRPGISIEVHTTCKRPPKPCTPPIQGMLEILNQCADDLGITFSARSTGGVCDGNILAAEGLPTLDTMGVVGDGLHTHSEFVWLPSLSQRAKLTAALLCKLAQQAPEELDWHKHRPKLEELDHA